MRTSWQTIVQPTVEAILHTSQVPGMVIALTKGDGPIEHLVLGTDGQSQPLRAETLFPVASICKLATALSILRLIADGELALDDPLDRYLPDAAVTQQGVTLRMLLSHTSGLPYDAPPELAPYDPELDWPTLARACLTVPLACPPCTRVTYSNVGFGLLAIAIERLTGHPFVKALKELVLTPLGIKGYLGVEPPRAPAWVVGELGEHAGTPLSPYNSVFWRRLALGWTNHDSHWCTGSCPCLRRRADRLFALCIALRGRTPSDGWVGWRTRERGLRMATLRLGTGR